MSNITTTKSYLPHNTLQSNGMTHDDVVMFTSPQLSFHWQANKDDIPGPVPPKLVKKKTQQKIVAYAYVHFVQSVSPFPATEAGERTVKKTMTACVLGDMR